MIVPVAAEDLLEPHFSCNKNDSEDSTTESLQENETPQSEIIQKLKNVNQDGEVWKFFEENKCSVCLSSYKEVLDNSLHIVVPSCGHPLCCECADKLLVGEKKECPRCKRSITAESFNLMKFNADLDFLDRIVYL